MMKNQCNVNSDGLCMLSQCRFLQGLHDSVLFLYTTLNLYFMLAALGYHMLSNECITSQ